MKRLLVVVVTAAVLWGGYWMIGASGVKTGFERWFDDRRTDGWQAEYSELSVIGFPNRFDTTVTNLALADPATGVAYTAPFLQIFALSYQPNHIIAIWPNTQRLATPLGAFDIASKDARASLVFEAGSSLTVDRSNIAVQDLAIAAPNGGTLSAKTLTFAVEQTPTVPNGYHFGINAGDLSLPTLPGLVLQSGVVPKVFDRFRGDMTVVFDRPWDRFALEKARPQPTRIDVKLFDAKLGSLELALAGSIDIDTAGVPTGEITVKAKNWRDIVELAVQTGLLPEQLKRPIEQGLGLLAGLSGNAKSIDLPLEFRGGRVNFGPIPLGPAPIFQLR